MTTEQWKDLARELADDSTEKLKERIVKDGGRFLDDQQIRCVRAMLFACMAATMNMVAEEAVQGRDVSGALNIAGLRTLERMQRGVEGTSTV